MKAESNELEISQTKMNLLVWSEVYCVLSGLRIIWTTYVGYLFLSRPSAGFAHCLVAAPPNQCNWTITATHSDLRKQHRDLRKYTETSESIHRIPKLYQDLQNYKRISKTTHSSHNYRPTKLPRPPKVQIPPQLQTDLRICAPPSKKKTIQRPSKAYTDLQNYKKKKPTTESLRIRTKSSKSTQRSQNLYRDLRKHTKTFKTILRPQKLHRDYRIYADTFETTKTYVFWYSLSSATVSNQQWPRCRRDQGGLEFDSRQRKWFLSSAQRPDQPCVSRALLSTCLFRHSNAQVKNADRNTTNSHMCSQINRLTPMGGTAPLTSKRCILYIYSTNIGTEYFKHALYSPFFFFVFKVQFVS